MSAVLNSEQTNNDNVRINRVEDALNAAGFTEVACELLTLDKLDAQKVLGEFTDAELSTLSYRRKLGLYFLNMQKFAPLMTRHVQKALGLKKVNSRLMKGDFVTSDGTYYESKITFLTDSNPMMNAVQIRPHEKDVALLWTAINMRTFDVRVYEIDHTSLLDLLDRFGSTAHMSEKITKKNEYVELALRATPSATDPLYQELQQFRNRVCENLIRNS